MPQGTLVIAGPTASGKSAVALRVAEAVGGVVINADAMQVYRELRILTARPGADDEARAPHRLYGIVSIAEPCSVGRWLELALAEIAAAHDRGLLPIVVGGSGLYLTALTDGLAPVPDVPADLRRDLRERLRRDGAATLHAELAAADPAMAAQLRPSDPQRVVRALEVIRATGTSLADWQRRTAGGPRLTTPWHGVVLNPPRDLLYRRCDARFEAMLAAGALDEVAAVRAAGFDPSLPAMKALGLPDLFRHLDGGLSRAQAVAAAQQATRRYAKRQLTWFRSKMISWKWLDEQDSECFFNRIMPFVSEVLLTPR